MKQVSEIAEIRISIMCDKRKIMSDPKNVIHAAAAKLGLGNMKSLAYSGSGWQGMVGQNFCPTMEWPRIGIERYTRTIDFETMAWKEEYTRDRPARGFTYYEAPTSAGGGTPNPHVTNFFREGHAWSLDAKGEPIPQPEAIEQRLLEVYLTPHGFIKGALVSTNAVTFSRYERGDRVTVVSYVVKDKYRINGTINAENLVQRVQTWIPDEVLGDAYVEWAYKNYRDINGVMMPCIHHRMDDGGMPHDARGRINFALETITDVQVNLSNIDIPTHVRAASTNPIQVQSLSLAEGVWLIAGGSHHSVLVEFRDHATVIEAPLNEARSLAVIDEVERLAPGKPIRYIINSHHHWDHLGGIRTYVHKGATIIAHENNTAYFHELLTGRAWTLKPDRLARDPGQGWLYGYVIEAVREKYAIGDDNRILELYHISSPAHAQGMLVAFLPKEKILVQGDFFNSAAVAPNENAFALNESLERLGLEVQTIVGLHGTPATISQFRHVLSVGQ
jgi:glyoxylase-like metal-dependent hydrolase (beta-lactamase superfamily II)